MPFGVAWWEILLVLLVILLVFGPKRLPEMGRSLGRGIREFKESVTGGGKSEDDRPELAPPPAPRESEPVASSARDRDTA